MWILPQHHTQIDRFYHIIQLIKTVRDHDLSSIREAIIRRLTELGEYQWRQTEDNLSAANHNIDEPFFYWLIYKINKKLFVSGYWELIYKIWDDPQKRAIVFLFSLFNVQYFNPAKTTCNARLYPFRLFFSILRDSRLENNLSIPEMFFLYQLDVINDFSQYESLIHSILEFRQSKQELKDFFHRRKSSL